MDNMRNRAYELIEQLMIWEVVLWNQKLF
jgi:hypothetical protein